jgi:hypothetical protein
MGIFDKAKDLIGSNPDKANQIIDKAGDMVDEKTGGKYAAHVDQGQDLARGHLGTEQAETPAPPAPDAPQDEAPQAEAPPVEAPPVEAPPVEAPPFEAPPAPEGVQPPAPEGEQPPA